MKIRSALLLTLALAIFSWCSMGAQPSEVEWYKTFGGSDYDTVESIQETDDGGYIIAGSTNSYGAGDWDVWLIKTDSEGNEDWNKTFGGSELDTGDSVQQTTDGGYIITGYTFSYSSNGNEIWLIKTDSSGNEEWNKTFGSGWGHSVRQTADGGYIIAGDAEEDVLLIKTDSKGNKTWDKSIGGSNKAVGFSVQETNDGGYIVIGNTEKEAFCPGVCDSNGAGNRDIWLIKADSAGNILWNKTFGGPEIDGAGCVRETADGGYVLAGITDSYGAGDRDIWLIKTDSKGDKIWDRTFGGPGFEWSQSAVQTSDGGSAIAGLTESFGVGDRDIWLIKTDDQGYEEWNVTFGGSKSDQGRDVIQNSNGAYVVAGDTSSYGAGSNDICLIKFSGESERTGPENEFYDENESHDYIDNYEEIHRIGTLQSMAFDSYRGVFW